MKARSTFAQSFSMLLFIGASSIAPGQTFYTPGGTVGSIAGTSVGVGTSNPSEKLEVAGGNVLVSGVTNPYVMLKSNAVGSPYGFLQYDQSEGNFMRIFDGSQYSMVWRAGKVGIGRTHPSAKLDVAGDIRNAYGTVAMPLGDWKTLTVGGSATEFYPVQIPTFAYRRDMVEIMQPDVHADGSSFGSMHFIAQFNHNGWGHVPSINKVWYNRKNGSNTYVARFSDAAYGMIPVVWLRGDQSYQYRVTNDGNLSVVGYVADTPVHEYPGAPQYNQYVSPMSEPDSTVPEISGYEMSFASGNVGIGTTNPTQKLSVNGTIRAEARGVCECSERDRPAERHHPGANL